MTPYTKSNNITAEIKPLSREPYERCLFLGNIAVAVRRMKCKMKFSFACFRISRWFAGTWRYKVNVTKSQVQVGQSDRSLPAEAGRGFLLLCIGHSQCSTALNSTLAKISKVQWSLKWWLAAASSLFLLSSSGALDCTSCYLLSCVFTCWKGIWFAQWSIFL